tara:strand:+ start:924 stop:2105 length:1182 start_codon:yes stop_codon:yes gene_type:complete
MLKDKYSTVIDFGSSELRLAVFNENLSKLFSQSKKILQKKNYSEYFDSINLLIKEAESKISTHLEDLIVLYESAYIYSIDLSIKKKLDQKINIKDFCSSIILEANQLIKDCYTNKKIIHSIIKKYIINDKEYLDISEKLISSNSIIIEMKFICLPYREYQDVIETFKKSNLKVINLFSSSLVKSFKYINSFKESNSVAFLDIGLDRTTAIFYNKQKIDVLKSISIGGNHISKDISQIMKLSIDESESLKKTFNKSEIDFSYNETVSEDNNIIKKIIGKNISIDLLKKVVLARIEEIIKLSFKDMNISESIDKKQNLNLVLIGNGSKIFNKNSFQLEDKYNFKEINFYEENDYEICKAGLIFRDNFKDINQAKLMKYQNKLGFFHKFFNFFGNN